MQRRRRWRTRVIILGDFNRHHPLWDEHRNSQLFTRGNLDRDAQILIDMLGTLDVEMSLPRDLPTLEHLRTKNRTRPDNVFVSRQLRARVISCTVEYEARPERTDHYPIRTVLDVSAERAKPREVRKWKTVDWSKFRATVALELPQWETPTSPKNTGEFEQLRERLTKALQTLASESPAR